MSFEKIVLHLLGAGVAFFVAWQYYDGITPEEPIEIVKWQVNPGRQGPLAQGAVLEAEDLVPITITLVEDRRSDFDWALDADPAIKAALIGQAVNQTVQPGAFLERRFFFTDTLRDFALRVKPGNRAFAVDIDGASSLLNFIGPGSRVDVIALIEQVSGNAEAEVILDNVEIMAVGPYDEMTEFDQDVAGRHRSVTFQAPPADIEHYLKKISQAQGVPAVVLRSAVEARSVQ